MKSNKLEMFSEITDKQIIITYQPNLKSWQASFKGCEIKEGSLLSSSYGTGLDPESALNNYLDKIRGSKLVFNAGSKERQEFNFPE